MIQTDNGLRTTHESLWNLQVALLGLTRKRAEYHPRTFELLVAPIADEIRARRAEIDEYIGLADAPGGSMGSEEMPDQVNGSPNAPSISASESPR